MQQYYGDEPRIISKRKIKRRKSNTVKAIKINGFAIFTVFLCVAVMLVAVIFNNKSGDILKIPADNWYYVSFYTRTTETDAAISAHSVKETGGAGYLINDGSFHVVASVYKSESDAKAVVSKQTLDASVYKLTVPGLKIPAYKDKETGKTVKKAFSYYGTVFKDIDDALVGFEKGQSTESALLHVLGNAKKGLNEMRFALEQILAESNTYEVSALIEWFSSAAATLDKAVLGSEESITLISSRVRYALCELVYGRYSLGIELNRQ